MMTNVLGTQVPVFQVVLPFVQGFRPDVGWQKSKAQTLEYEIKKRYEDMAKEEKKVQDEIDLLQYNPNLINKVTTERSFTTREEALEQKREYLERLKGGWRSPQYLTDSVTSRNYGFTFGNQLDSMKAGSINFENYKQGFIDSIVAQTIYDSLLHQGVIDRLGKNYKDNVMDKDPYLAKEIIESFVPMLVLKLGTDVTARDAMDIKNYIEAEAKRRGKKP